MNLNKPEEIMILTENVALVRPHDSNALPPLTITSRNFYAFTGDAAKTIQLAIASSRAFVLQQETDIPNLFGAWLESGDEDKQLDVLYKSRLTISSLPNE